MSILKSSLIYAGLDRDRFEALLPEAQRENGHYLSIYSSMLSMIFAVCLLVSILAGGKLVINRPIYILMIVVGFGLYLSTKLIVPRHASYSTVFAIIFIISMYGYSFAVSLLHSDMQGVAAVAILLVMPCLFKLQAHLHDRHDRRGAGGLLPALRKAQGILHRPLGPVELPVLRQHRRAAVRVSDAREVQALPVKAGKPLPQRDGPADRREEPQLLRSAAGALSPRVHRERGLCVHRRQRPARAERHQGP